MEKRIELERRGRSSSQVKELNLDNCRSTNIVGLTDKYVNLEQLSLNNVGLTSLKGFPALPNLKRLELSDNRISNGLQFLNTSPKLTHLHLSGNKIKDLETLEALKEFKSLKNLDLYNNEVTSVDGYRTKVFALCPSLNYLDGFDQDDREADDSDGEEDELNGNNDSDDEDGVSDEDEEDDEEEDIGLSAVYNDNLEEESSESVLYEGSDVEEEEDDYVLDEEDEDAAPPQPEESTRGKKRKHEDDSEQNN